MGSDTSLKNKALEAVKARLQTDYEKKYLAELKDQLGLANPHQVPKLEKIVLSVGLGKAKDDKRLVEIATNTLRKISGQSPIKTVAKKSIASFKLRQGVTIGLKVTLRGQRMYEFADRFINLVIPRLRDFHGVSHKSFDRQGNFNIGLTDQSVFPELNYDDIATTHGLQIIFQIKSKSTEHSKALLERLGIPFEKALDDTRGKGEA